MGFLLFFFCDFCAVYNYLAVCPVCNCDAKCFFPPNFLELDLTLRLPQSMGVWAACAGSKSEGSKRSLQPWMLLHPLLNNGRLFYIFKSSLNSSQHLLDFSSSFRVLEYGLYCSRHFI